MALVDVATHLQTDPADPVIRILKIIGGANDLMPARIDRGIYLIQHFSFDHVVAEDVKLEEYPELPTKDYLGCYGVCDDPQQFIRRFGDELEQSPRRFCIAFTCVRKADQPKRDGWRWHKWGEYVGEGSPTTEYLADEPVFNEVYVYHVYEVLGRGVR